MKRYAYSSGIEAHSNTHTLKRSGSPLSFSLKRRSAVSSCREILSSMSATGAASVARILDRMRDRYEY